MSLPKTCSHGVPFGKDDYCPGCELVSERSGLEWALTKAGRHRKRIAEIEAEHGNADSPGSGQGPREATPDVEVCPGRNT